MENKKKRDTVQLGLFGCHFLEVKNIAIVVNTMNVDWVSSQLSDWDALLGFSFSHMSFRSVKKKHVIENLYSVSRHDKTSTKSSVGKFEI